MFSRSLCLTYLAVTATLLSVKGSDDSQAETTARAIFIKKREATNQSVTPTVVTVTYATPRSQLMQRDMPDRVVLHVKVGKGSPRKVTLYKQPQHVMTYVFTSDPNAPPVPVTPERKQDLTWFSTRYDTNPQMSVSFCRTPVDGSPFTDIYMSADGLMVLNNQAYFLNISPSSTGRKDTSERIVQTYHMKSIHATLPDTLSRRRREVKHESCKQVVGSNRCSDIHVDVCVHADYDMFVRIKKYGRNVDAYATDLIHKAGLVYQKLPRSTSFPYRIHLDLVSVFVEEDFAKDPIQLRDTPLAQFVVDGQVYEDIVKAHDLLTDWLSKNHRPQCDFYLLLSGARTAEFKHEKHAWAAYTSTRVGLTWDRGICRYVKGRQSSVVVEGYTDLSFFVVAHEIGHSLGLVHSQSYPKCKNSVHSVMDKTLRHDLTFEKSYWSQCAIRNLKTILDSDSRKYPGCYVWDREELDKACSGRFGANYTFTRTSAAMSDVCNNGLWCRDWSNGLTDKMNAPIGTACGSGKRCDKGGKCVMPLGRHPCD